MNGSVIKMGHEETIINWLQIYFEQHHCQIKQHGKQYQIHLTRKLDEQLMNRPFYWRYMDMTGNEGEPSTITYHFNEEQLDENYMHLGHPLLMKITSEISEAHQYFTGFEQIHTNKQVVLHPYFFMNIIIRFVGKHVREEMMSIGINLINGTIMTQFMESIADLTLEQTISPYCYTVRPIISMQRATDKIHDVIYKYIEQLPHQWAIDSLQEIALANRQANNKEQVSSNLKEIEQILSPNITFNIMSGGTIYIRPDVLVVKDNT